MFSIFKRKKKLDYKLIDNPTNTLDLDNDDILVAYAIEFFTGVVVGGNKCDKESVELAKKLIILLRNRGLEHKLFSSFNIEYMTLFEIGAPTPKTYQKVWDF